MEKVYITLCLFILYVWFKSTVKDEGRKGDYGWWKGRESNWELKTSTTNEMKARGKYASITNKYTSSTIIIPTWFKEKMKETKEGRQESHVTECLSSKRRLSSHSVANGRQMSFRRREQNQLWVKKERERETGTDSRDCWFSSLVQEENRGRKEERNIRELREKGREVDGQLGLETHRKRREENQNKTLKESWDLTSWLLLS